MKNDELKERLISVLQEGAARGGVRRTTSYEERRYGKILITVKQDVTEVEINFGVFADALIAAGLRFGENLTATFDRMALEREHELERRLAEAEHRAEVTEKKYRIALTNYAKLHREATRYNKMTATYDAEITKQAEEELNKESKD